MEKIIFVYFKSVKLLGSLKLLLFLVEQRYIVKYSILNEIVHYKEILDLLILKMLYTCKMSLL